MKALPEASRATPYDRFKGLLNTAHAAVEELALRNITPRQISLGGDRPVIQIDTPAGEPWMRGAMRLRTRSGSTLRTVMAAPFHGCRLEWEVTESRYR